MYKVWASPLKATIVKTREEAVALQMMVCAASGSCCIIEPIGKPNNEKTTDRPNSSDTGSTGAS